MPRPLEREKPLQRVNVMLDCEALENAQRAAALVGVDPSIVGSNSAFIRWLIDEYNKSHLILTDEQRRGLRSVPQFVIDMAEACATAENISLEALGINTKGAIECVTKRLKNKKTHKKFANTVTRLTKQ